MYARCHFDQICRSSAVRRMHTRYIRNLHECTPRACKLRETPVKRFLHPLPKNVTRPVTPLDRARVNIQQRFGHTWVSYSNFIDFFNFWATAVINHVANHVVQGTYNLQKREKSCILRYMLNGTKHLAQQDLNTSRWLIEWLQSLTCCRLFDLILRICM